MSNNGDQTMVDLRPHPVEEAATLPMLHAYLPMMTASALATAGRLGLFEALVNGDLTVSALARTLSASANGTERLVNFLAAAGFLVRRGDRVANTPATASWFTSDAAADYSTGLAWTSDAWRIMGDLPEAVLAGRPRRLLWDRMEEEPDLGVRFARYMATFAQHLAPHVRSLVDLPIRPARLLDLGGSHGHHAITLCHAFPHLHAVIVDLGSALSETQARIERENLADRITLRTADLRDGDWGEGYDLALYLSVAHNMSPAENRANLANVSRALRPEGALILHDYPHETTPPLFTAAFDLTLLSETGTRTYGYAELGQLLEEAGFQDHQLHLLRPAEKGALILARKRPPFG